MLGVPPDSAAQNGPVTQTCTKCGAINEAHAQRCRFCDARLAPAKEAHVAGVPSAPTEGNLAVELDWRREVAHRLESYRARRRRLRPNDAQTALPFSSDAAAPAEPFANPEPIAAERRARPLTVERVEITVTQPDLDFADAADRPCGTRSHGAATIGAPLVPMAGLDDRRRAGLLDAAFLLLAYGAFLALFGSLGGHFAFGKFDAAVYAVTLALFYAQYFALFTVFGGATPGMLLCGLRVVSFDGSAPAPRQLLWRSFGYLVSGGTVLLGFLWALWDEDHLTWQDRISQTYLMHAEKPRISKGGETPR